ncbi:SET and MYND domain-containing protein 4-like [Plodia interpunctella]|uniref:SET and MYND domain-containing protein 4-like n=1 Tax=Plodia interpunctella TaxID=58824 RepID=UPI0023685EEC|nr:SET and MYND domain-containing protein 4-like [Plodia interpunctella]
MSIDDCYHSVIKKLTDEDKIIPTSQKLSNLTKNYERVLYVYEILGSLNTFPNVLEVSKSVDLSTKYRNLGNKHYQQRDNYTALQYYNLSLLYAPPESEAYSLSIANRSAVLFTLKANKECIKDIELVFRLKFPEKLRNKLNNRKEMCQKHLPLKKVTQKQYENDQFIKFLTPGANNDSRYVCASVKLEVVFSKEMGRHVVAKEDIKVGEILAQEEPYFVLLLKSQYLLCCSYCLSRDLNLIPCHSCCFALFCSEQCKKKAWVDYHGVECSLMATLIHMEFTKLEWLGLRTVIRARNDHTDWKSLFQTIKKAEENADTEFRGHVKIDGKWIYDSKYYTSIHMLASNVEKRSVSDIFQKSVTAAVFLKLLEKTNFLKGDNEDNDEIIKCVAGMLLHHIMTSPTNMHGISSIKQNSMGNYVDDTSIASASYAFHSLINHSCAPNVVRFNKLGTGQMTLFALRPIKKGMQIFDNYGSHHAMENFTSRQSSLKFQYKFTCLCEACVNKWPMYFNLQPARRLPPHINSKKSLLRLNNIENLQKGDVKTACKLFEPLCDFAGLLEPYCPCLELADCQETLKQCLQIFGGLIPYFVDVEWSVIPEST